jgi:LSD1 subclass zinc finger protein
MSQLLGENLRLQQELQNFRSSNSATNETQEIEALQRSMNFTSSSRQQSTQQHPLQAQHSHQQPQQLAQQQQQTSHSQDAKYICCGNCRQWLSAPRDATYVYCPGCQAVNNCSMAPAPTSPPAVRAPPRV